MTNSDPSSDPPFATPWMRRLVYVGGAILLVLLAIPWVLAKTSLRDRLLTAIVNSDELNVQSQDASFGYFAALSLTGLRIESKNKATLIKVQRISADRSWLGLLLSRPELGTFRFDQPTVDVRIEEENRGVAEGEVTIDKKAESIGLPTLTAEIRDAAIIVRTSQSGDPPIDIENIDVTFRVQRQQGQSVLRIDATTVFDHQAITPELCGHGLQLIAPLLADEFDAEGEFSLRLREFQVPLGETETPRGSAIRIEGELELHHASVALKNTITKKIAGLAAELIGDSLPEKMTVAKGVKVRFQVIDGRIHHEGLALLLPHGDSSIEIVSGGSVGLDETLDLQVSIQLPAGLLGESALGKKLTSDPMVIAIGGTLDDPEIGLPKKVDWVQAIEGLIAADDDDPTDDDPASDSLEEAVTDLIGGLLKRASGQKPPALDEEQPALDEEPVQRERVFPRIRERLRNRPLRRPADL